MTEPATAARLDTCEHKQCIPFDRCLYGDNAEPTQPLDTAACSHAGFHEAMSMQCRECGYQPGPATASAFEALLASADPETPNEIDGIDVHHAVRPNRRAKRASRKAAGRRH